MSSTIIPVLNIDNIQLLKSLFERHVDRHQLEQYKLPVTDDRAQVIVGLSGGADSSVLALFSALYLSPRYPNLEFLFTDTKAEPDSCYETLDKIERLTGISITRITPEKGLFELIDAYNGFLPNGQARWCTKKLKVDPLMAYMKSVNSEHGFISLAGIRFDEANREGISFQYSMENASAAFPFIDLEITKHMVFDILHNSIGIPSTYAYRSRSGCFSCFFQRNAEAIGMLFNDPAGFMRTEALEKLSNADSERWEATPTALTDVGIRGYYPVPAFIDIRKPEKVPAQPPVKLKLNQVEGMVDMFGHDELEPEEQGEELYAAFALYTDDHLGWFGGREFTPGVYWQEFVSVSTSLPGIKSALGTYYKFKKSTPMPQYDVEDLQIVIAQIRFPKGAIDSAPPSKDSFTWKKNIAYKQLRHLAKNCQLTLERVDLERQFSDAVNIMRNAQSYEVAIDASEKVLALKSALNAAPKATGTLVWEGLYIPSKTVAQEVQMQLAGISIDTDIKPARESLEFDEVPMACLACSI